MNVEANHEEDECEALVNEPASLAWLEKEVAEVEEEIANGMALNYDPGDLVPATL